MRLNMHDVGHNKVIGGFAAEKFVIVAALIT